MDFKVGFLASFPSNRSLDLCEFKVIPRQLGLKVAATFCHLRTSPSSLGCGASRGHRAYQASGRRGFVLTWAVARGAGWAQGAEACGAPCGVQVTGAGAWPRVQHRLRP